MSNLVRSRVTPSRAEEEYSLLPGYTPSSSPPPAKGMIDDYLKYLPSYRTRHDKPTKCQIFFSTLYGALLATVIVIVVLKMKAGPREQNYHQWLSTKMASGDPFDQLGLGAGVGPVERSMWGLHELGGWDGEAYRREKGLLELGDGGQRYRLYHNDSAEGAIK